MKRLLAFLITIVLSMSSVEYQVFATSTESDVEKETLHEVVIKEDSSGKIELDRKESLYAAGETVMLQVKPEVGYHLQQVEIVNADTKELLLYSDKTQVSFEMPENQVLVEAVYKSVSETKNEVKASKANDFQTTEQKYTKTFKVNGVGGTLRILDIDGKVLEELTENQEKVFEYAAGSKAPDEVWIEAVAEPGYQVLAYETKWYVAGQETLIPENNYEINTSLYERGHYLASAAWDETFVVSFGKEGAKMKEPSYVPAKRTTANIDNPKVGDIYTGSAYLVYDGYPNKTYNGTGYIVPTTGDFVGDSIIMSTCESGSNFWAPQTGQTGSYTITITSVDTATGTVTCSVYWKNDENYAYQNLSSTYSYHHDFNGDLSVYKAMADSLSAYVYPYEFKENLDLRATFGIYSDAQAKNKVAEIKTDKDGKPIRDGVSLNAGTYYVKELIAPKGFALNETIKKVTIGAGAAKSATIKDRIYRAKVKGVKIDALTGTTKPTSGLSMEGAEYSVYGDAAATKLITKGYTDKNGNIEFDCVYFAYGTYYIQETKAPKGYQLDKKVYKVVVDETLGFYPDSMVRLNDVEFTSKEEPDPGTGKVKKVSSNPGISEGNSCYSYAGGEFKLTNVATKEEVKERFVLKDNGESQEITLQPGKYIVEETKSPLGFVKSNETQTIEIKPNQTTVCRFENIPVDDPIDILLQKKDAETGKIVSTGSGTFENAEYTFRYYDGYYTSEAELMGKAPKRTWVLATNSDGMIFLDDAKKVSGDDFYLNRFGMRTLPLGTVTIKETKAPTGYKLDPTLYIRNIKAEEGTGEIIQSFQVAESPEPVIRGGFRIEKLDRELNERTTQGEASLKDTTIQIINRSSNAVFVEGKLYKTGEVVKTVTTDGEGVYESAKDLLPYGDYEAKELTPPTGYQSKGKLKEYFEIRVDGVIEELTGDRALKNDPIRGGIQIEKWDNETDSNVAQGGASFKNTTIQIINRSKKAVLVEESLYAPGEVVKTVMTDDFGVYRSANDLLPYGNYEVVEVLEPKGYLATGKLKESFKIRKNGVIEELTGDKAIKNEPIRGDLKGVKVAGGDMQRLANVPFQITSMTTGESHIVVTDENGMFDTSSTWNPHSRNTNRGETAEDGIWFGGLDTLDDNKGALLYDYYSIEELPCEANADKILIPAFVVRVSRNMVTIDLGTVINEYEPVVSIHTKAVDIETGQNNGYSNETTTIEDTVSYVNLIPEKEYTLKGILMDKESGRPLLINGTEVTTEKTFQPAKANGSVTLSFTFDSLTLKGKEVVVFERLYYEGHEIAAHTELTDQDQTIQFEKPDLKTTASDKGTGDHNGYSSELTTIEDIVKYTGLIPGKEYVVKGILMDKESGQALLVHEKEVTAEKTFIASAASGSITLSFTFDSSALKGKEIVAFETLYFNEREIAVHADIDDKDQTVTYEEPKLETTARDKESGGHTGFTNEQTTIIDKVKYKGLIPGKAYTMKGVLMDKATGKAFLVDKREVTAEKIFVAVASEGSLELEFTFDSPALRGKSVVVFESLFYENREIAVHTDIEDKDQTVKYEEPQLKTTAADKESKENSGFVRKKTTIVDKVEYIGLMPGKEYTIKGVLMDRETGKALQIEKKEVTAEKTFTAAASKGGIELEFTFDSTALRGKSVVVFESLYYEGREIATHTDIEDKNQTVKYEEPELKTTAMDKESKENSGFVQKKTTIIDKVEYTGLIPGKEYTIKGVLMNQETGKALLVEKKEVSAEKTFTAAASEGSTELEFTFDSLVLKGKEVVVFERLYYEGRKIAVHIDIEDKNQTVKYQDPGLKTTASEKNTGKKEITVKETISILDVIVYKNLIPGKEYMVKGILMDKATGKPLEAKGKQVTAQKKFTADRAKGSVEMEFTLEASELAGKEVVVFEKIYYEGREIAVHEDINDEGQTVTFIEPEAPKVPETPGNPKTGDNTQVVVYMILAFLLIIMLGINFYKSKKNRK